MQLSYRGHSYNQDAPAVDMVDSGMTGSYRGRTYALTYPRHIPVAQPTHNLVYRGAAYTTTTTGGIQSTARPKPAAQPIPAGVIRMPYTLQGTYDSVHRLNIQRRLQQRIEAAKARGDQKLLMLLEREMQQAG